MPPEAHADAPERRQAAVKRAQLLAASARLRASVSSSTAWPPPPWTHDLQGWLQALSAAAIEQALDAYARDVAARSLLDGSHEPQRAEDRGAEPDLSG